jgi:hypothetical protein
MRAFLASLMTVAVIAIAASFVLGDRVERSKEVYVGSGVRLGHDGGDNLIGPKG